MTSTPRRGVVIVGAGSAGASTASTLRTLGFDAPITLIGDEPELPYRRPIVSKEALSGEKDVDQALIKPREFWAQNQIELRTGQLVLQGDSANRTIQLDSGEAIAYESLVLATGAAARELPGLPSGPRVHYLRSYDDALRLRTAMAGADSVAVIGAGLIGSEVASAATNRGLAVTVIDAAPRPLARVVPPLVGDRLARLQRDAGVDLRLGTTPGAIEVSDTGVQVGIGDDTVAADLLVVAVGAKPSMDLARLLGVDCDDGVVVDASYRTSVGDVFAIGDCARVPGQNGAYRAENIAAATEHGAAVAHVICGESVAPVIPWGWSAQFGQSIQFAGWPQAADDTVVEGDLDGQFLLRCLSGGRLVGAVAIGKPRELRAARGELAAQLDTPGDRPDLEQAVP